MDVATIFPMFSIFAAIIAISITLISITILITKLRRNQDTVLLLLLHTYLTILLFASLTIIVNGRVLHYDIHGSTPFTDADLHRCQIEGFLLFVLFGLSYLSFTLQAFYRFVRVIYYKYRFLQSFRFYATLIPIAWISYGLIVLPSYFWPSGNPYELFLRDHYCGILYENLRPLMFTVLFIFMFPLFCILILYAGLLLFMRTQASQAMLIHRVQRDILVTRRIFLTVNGLMVPCLANVVFVIISNADPSLSGSYYMYRVQWFAGIISILVSSILLVINTPQLKQLLAEKLWLDRNRVIPINTVTHTINGPTMNRGTAMF